MWLKGSPECNTERVKECWIKHWRVYSAKDHDLWMYQNEKEAKKKAAGRQELRKDEERVCQTGKKPVIWKMASSDKESLSCQMRLKAFPWTWMEKLPRAGKRDSHWGEEIVNPTEKVIRVESEETPYHVRVGESTEQEEEEERTFVWSAVSVPLKPVFRCDRQCSEKIFVCGGEWRPWVFRPTCVRSVSKDTFRRRRRATDKCEVEASCGERRRLREQCGKWWRRNHISFGCENVSPVKDRRPRKFGSWPTEKSRMGRPLDTRGLRFGIAR